MQRGIDENLTYFDAVNERFPIAGTGTFEHLFPSWQHINPFEIQNLESRKRSLLKTNRNSRKYLIHVCEEKISLCRNILGGKK